MLNCCFNVGQPYRSQLFPKCQRLTYIMGYLTCPYKERGISGCRGPAAGPAFRHIALQLISAAVQSRLDLANWLPRLPTRQQSHISHTKTNCCLFLTVCLKQTQTSPFESPRSRATVVFILSHFNTQLRTGKRSTRSCRSPAATSSRTRPPTTV